MRRIFFTQWTMSLALYNKFCYCKQIARQH